MRQEHVRLVLEGWALEAVVWDKAPSHRAKSLAKLATVRVFLPAYRMVAGLARIVADARRELVM